MEDFEEAETEEVTNYAGNVPAFVDHNPGLQFIQAVKRRQYVD
jgi:hypothetical protein